MEIYEALQNISKPYPLFSRERNLVSKVSCWIQRASKSLIPDSYLIVAEGHIEHHERVSNIRESSDNNLTSKLKKIVDLAYEKYVEGRRAE